MSAGACRISVVLPTFNEAANVRRVVGLLRETLEPLGDWEILVVDDDSPDLTWRIVEEIGAEDPRVRCFRRVDRRGLASAIVDGLTVARGERRVVMDADLQHDPGLVPRLAAALDDADIAVASRYMEGGSVGEWGALRRWISRGSTRLSRLLLGIRSSDPMSGFFAIRREAFQQAAGSLQPRGYKALMELLYRLPGARIAELPLRFGLREAGESKLGGGVALDFLLAIVELRTGRALSQRFLGYCAVGATGVAVQLLAFAGFDRVLGVEAALALAILTAMVWNFTLNNLWTFRDRRLRGATAGSGLLRFLLVSGVGAFINHSLTIRFDQLTASGLYLASLVGIAVATIWNYQLNRGITWGMWDRPE